MVKIKNMTKADWVAQGVDPRSIIDTEQHPSYYVQRWPLSSNDTKMRSETGHHHFPSLKPKSVLIATIGNMWADTGHHRLQDMMKSMVEKGYTVCLQEINDICIHPSDHIAQMRNEAAYLALDSGCEFLFLMDTDVLLELDTIERLMEWDVPVVGPYLNDLEQRWVGSHWSYPVFDAGVGLAAALWTLTSPLLIKSKVFNAIGTECFGSYYGLTEFQFAQKLNHVCHTMFIDTNTVVDVATSPSRTRTLDWETFWSRERARFEKSRYEERNRQPPEGYIPVNGTISPSCGAYFPLGNPFIPVESNE